MYNFALVGCKPETVPGSPFLYAIDCMLQMSLNGIKGSSSKTDRQVINKECSEDVLLNMRRQFINLQFKTGHSQDTTRWNSLLWIELVGESGSDSHSDSAVPEVL